MLFRVSIDSCQRFHFENRQKEMCVILIDFQSLSNFRMGSYAINILSNEKLQPCIKFTMFAKTDMKFIYLIRYTIPYRNIAGVNMLFT